MARLKIYFLGSGAIGLPSLDACLSSSDVELVGIGTQPDMPSGRDRRVSPTPVGVWAVEHGFAAAKPSDVNTPDFAVLLSSLAPDILFVASFGQLLRQRLLDLPSQACVNLHASLLPRHRGASPLQAAILSGDLESGVSFMRMERGLDTGPVYARFSLPIETEDTASDLERKIAGLAGAKAVETLLGVASGALIPEQQDGAAATHASKMSKSDGLLDWTWDASRVVRAVRAYNPWPCARFVCHVGTTAGAEVKVMSARVAQCSDGGHAPGQVLSIKSGSVVLACGAGAVELSRVVPPGRREMGADEFARGARLRAGDIL